MRWSGFLIILAVLFNTPVLADQIDDAILARASGNVDKSIDLLLPLAQTGIARAQFELGISYGFSGNEEQGASWVEAAAESGYSEAAFILGASYLHEDLSAEDHEKGTYWLQRAANEGHELAASLLRASQQSAERILCKPTLSSDRNAANWILYEYVDEMTDKRSYELVSRSIDIGDGAVIYLEVEASKVVVIRANRPLGRNLARNIGVRIDSGTYYPAESAPVRRGFPHEIYNALQMKEAGLISHEQYMNVARTGNIDGIVAPPPSSLTIDYEKLYRNTLIDEMKKGNQIKVRIVLDGRSDSTIVSLSLVGFTQAYEIFKACRQAM